MPLKTIATIPQPPKYEVQGSGWVAFHDNSKVLEKREFTSTTNSGRRLIAADTEAELDAEITRLGLTPLALTPRQQVAKAFRELPADKQARYGAIFTKIAEMTKDEDVIDWLQDLPVLPEDESIKAAFLATLRGE